MLLCIVIFHYLAFFFLARPKLTTVPRSSIPAYKAISFASYVLGTFGVGGVLGGCGGISCVFVIT